MSTLSQKLKETGSLDLLSSKELYEILQTDELTEKEISENIDLFQSSINEFLIEDDAFNGLQEDMGGEFNFTEIAKTPSEKQALIDKVLDLNKRFINDKKTSRINQENKSLILRSQIEELLKEPDNKERYDFVSFLKDGVEIFGIVREDIVYNGENFSSVIPFFQTDTENPEDLKLLRNQESILIQNKEITKILEQKTGIDVWKDLIKKEGVNPELEISSKTKHIISPKVEKALTKNKFSLKKLFDDSLRDSQNILKGVARNANFEDVFNEIFVCIKKSESFQAKKTFSAVYKMFQPIIEDESQTLQKRMNALVNVINEESKLEDLKFIDDFTHKFKNGELSDEDMVQLIKKYESLQDNSISSVITEFVEVKKQELSLHPDEKIIEILNVNKEKVAINDIVSFEDKGKYQKGRVIGENEGLLKIELYDKSVKEVSEDNTTKLFKGQKYTIEQVQKAFVDSNIQLKYDDLSNESKINLLKGEMSQVFNSTYIKQDQIGFKISENKDFKLVVKFDENRKLVLKPVFKNNEFKIDEFEMKGQKLTEDQKKDLLDNKMIVFEVFDKNGTLQYQSDMKYDAQLNDILYYSNKGENYAKSIKEGKSQEFTAKTTIIDKGTGIKM
ncbi:hypothetical protein [Chryseobacterium muglaense]|uniref:DUF3945 domain-containing protein n=1 Tax=Chryseobacterium muglaense TaxID=2893752 RepID=A0ABR8M8Z0_9FLAO|nr:hypothetical protein [Chryseobacterium muglaense]MBD3906774.1 hypothetical protein [Chryseobacterium muglaense]